MIALPYGPGADWIKNVLAKGSATIVNEGETWLIDRPELVPVAAPYMPAKEQRELRRFAIDRCLRVHRVEPDDGSSRGEEGHAQGEVRIPADRFESALGAGGRS